MSAVHTSAPGTPPDMFASADIEAANSGDLVLEFKGVLIHAAEVRTKVVGEDQHPVPVLCLDVRPLSGIKRVIHAEQVYTESTRKAAEAKASTLKRGAQITVRTNLTGMRTVFPHVRSVVLNPQS